MSRASLLARLPLYCSAECATPTNSSILQFFRGIWPMPLSLLNHSALALFAQRTRIPTSARSIGFCAIWVCISSSSSSSTDMRHATCVKEQKAVVRCTINLDLRHPPSLPEISYGRRRFPKARVNLFLSSWSFVRPDDQEPGGRWPAVCFNS